MGAKAPRRRAPSGSQGPAPDVGVALRARADEIADRLVAAWRAHATGSSETSPEDDIWRSSRAGVLAVADYLETGEVITQERSEAWDKNGAAPLMGGISLSEVTKSYLRWRDLCRSAVREEAERLGADPRVVSTCVGVVELGTDVSLVRMAKRFEITREALEAALEENQERLEHQAMHDPLTGLANRALLIDRLVQALRATQRRTTRSAVLFLDLDYFKSVNDAAGHSAGDQLLVAVAERLKEVVRPTDTVARLGGDEFIVMCDDLTDPELEGVAVAERIASRLAEPFNLAGNEIYVAASVGVAPSAQGDNAEELIERADQAMYRAKQLGRGRIEVYHPDLNKETSRQAEVSHALHQALPGKQLHVAYQPVLDLSAQRIVVREALLRWEHPQLGKVSPVEFIPLAEQTGLITGIGRWVLGQACRDCAAWQHAGSPEVGVAVNVSGRQLETSQFEEDVAEALEVSGLAPSSLTLEITETLLMAGRAEARAMLERLRGLGVRIAIDDFGTGYSSLSWLARLPLDILKVDRSFIASLGLIERESAIVRAMIHLAHTLGLSVVAEGVETDFQLEELTSLGCDEAQGFLLGQPESLADPETAAALVS